MLKDMTPHFELFQPDTVEAVVELLDLLGEDGWALTGGYDSLDWFKNRSKRPAVVVDLEGLEALRGVRSPSGERIIAAEDFFMGPAVDIIRMTVLEPDDLTAFSPYHRSSG